MRKTFLFLFLLSCVAHLSAQELTIKSFTVATTDISASQYPRQDLTKNYCGLVKVQLAVPGAQFEGNVIAPVENKTGEYWVYMTEGSKELVVKTPSTLPLHVDFTRYSISGITPKATYVLVLTAPSGAAETDSRFQYLVLTVKPANSVVSIDGQLRPVEDGSVSALLPQGTHTYRVESPGYAPEEGSVEIGTSRRTLEVSLRSIQARLSVSCPTSGCEVWLDERQCGPAPWTSSPLSPGNYVVEVRKEGFRSRRETVSLSESEVRQVDFPALEAKTGILDVNYQPVNSEVYLDGRRLGASPDVFKNIPVGQHRVEIRKSGYATKQETVVITDGQTKPLSGQLQASRKTKEPSQPKPTGATATSKSQREYLRPTCGYVQAGLQLGTLMGASLHAGAYLHNVNVEAYGLLGLSGETVYLNYTDGKASQEETLKAKMLGIKVGYGIPVGSRLRLTPQVGLGGLSVKGSDIAGSAVCATVGCRVDFALTSFLGLNLTPEGQFALSKKDVFTQLSELSSKVSGWGGGGGVRLGIYVNF